MPRYVNYEWWEVQGFESTRTVIEEDKSPVDTGLLDMHGHTIYRVHTAKMGFDLTGEATMGKGTKKGGKGSKGGKGGKGY